MFLTSFAGQLGDAAESQMIIYKSCRVDFGYNDTVCENLIDDFPDENTEIQNEVSIIYQTQKKKCWITK